MLADMLVLVQSAVRDDSQVVTPEDYLAAIALAVSRYSSDRPRYWVVDVPASGSDSLPLPDAWELDFSNLISVEYPIGEFPPEIWDADQYVLYQAPSGWLIRLAFAPMSDVRLTYSIAQVLTELEDTIPLTHREAVACWEAASCCDQLASFYANASDSTIQADRVERQNQSRDYAARAKVLRSRYLSELGVDEKKSAPAGVVVDLDLTDSFGNDRFIHGRRYR